MAKTDAGFTVVPTSEVQRLPRRIPPGAMSPGRVRKIVGDALTDKANEPEVSPQLEFVLRSLGVDLRGCSMHRDSRLTSMAMTLTLVHLGRLAEQHGIDLVASDADSPAAWTTLDLSDGTISHPSSLMAFWPAGTLDPDVAVVTEVGRNPMGAAYLGVATATRDRPRLEPIQAGILEAALGPANPYRNNYLRATVEGDDFSLAANPWPSTSREDLVMPDEIWDRLDACVHRHLARLDQLAALDLGLRQGIVLHGPPGTGKTHLCRLLAAELRGQVTVLVADQAVVGSRLDDLYSYASRLAPCLVVLEDVDLAAARRGGQMGPPLQALLVALDGMDTPDVPVITIATTNDVDALDLAAKRASRLEHAIEVPAPNRRGRELIFRGTLAPLDEGQFDHARLAQITEGATGADIRALIRRALMGSDAALTTARLVAAAEEEGFGARSHGNYL